MKIYNPTGFSTNLTGSFSGSVKGTLTATGNIIPDVSGAYDIGSTAFPFKDLYITQNSLKFIDDSTGTEIGRISVNSNTGDIKLLNTKNLTEEEKANLTAENVGAEALSPVSASAIWVSQSISPGHERTSIGHTNQKFHTVHTQYVSASSTAISGDLTVGGKVTAQEFHTEFVSASIIYESGSTQFGNSADDTHIFTGKVGIGTSDIEETLTVSKTDGGDGTVVGLRSDAGFSQFEFETKESQVSWGLNAVSNRNIYFTTNGTERMRITGGGNVGIGITSPCSKLHLHEASTSTPSVVRLSNNVASGNNDITLSQISTFIEGQTTELSRIEVKNSSDAHDNGNIIFYTRDGYANTFGSRMGINHTGVGIGTLSPDAIFHVAKSNAGGLGGQVVIDNPAASTLGNTVELTFLTDAGASGAATRNGRIKLVNENAGNGAANMQFWTWNGAAEGERIRITSGGNVGIGVASPGERLAVCGPESSTYTISWQNQNRIKGGLYSDTGGVAIQAGTNFNDTAMYMVPNTSFDFRVNGSTRVYFSCSGNVGINTTSPSKLLEVAGPGGGGGTLVRLNQTSGTGASGPSLSLGFGGQDWRVGANLFVCGDFTIYNACKSANMIRIADVGYVGIGTIGPNAKLDLGSNINGCYRNAFLFYNDNVAGPYHGTKKGIYVDQFGLSNNSTFLFSTAAGAPGTFIIASKDTTVNDASSLTPRMTIQGQTGNVGIGNTSPSGKLHVSGPVIIDGTCNPSAGINYLGKQGYTEKWLVTQGRYRFCFGTLDFYGNIFLDAYGTNYSRGTNEIRVVRAAIPLRYSTNRSLHEIYKIGNVCVGAYLTSGLAFEWINLNNFTSDLIITNSSSVGPDSGLAIELSLLSNGFTLSDKFYRVCYTSSEYNTTNPYK